MEKGCTMPTAITRQEVQKLMQDEEAVLVEVLPSQEYEDEHIMGATNIPLKRLDKKTVSHLDKAKPIIVY